MTYQVLARKWRPRDFASLVGQEHVVRALTHALEQQRLHHAYLFTGTRGVGKTTLSRILAKALNCETGITATPCGVCSACKAIDGGSFVDYIEMDAASNRGVEEMGTLLERAVYAPVDARFKVYMIDEVHMLTTHAFNAMLKTLEEPPAHVKFILATTDSQKIPVTVLSRCLQFNLKQMPAGHIVGHLEHVLQAESVAFEPQALRLLARAADGSMRDALSLTDQAIAYAAGAVSEEGVRAMLGAIDQHYLIDLLDAVAASDGGAVLRLADEMAARSLSFSTALQDLSSLLHRIAWAQAAPGSVLDEWPEAADMRRLASSLTPESVQLYYQIATIGRHELGLAPDEYAGFTMALLRMLAFGPSDAAAATLPGLAVEARPPTAPVPAAVATAVADSSRAVRAPDLSRTASASEPSRGVSASEPSRGVAAPEPSPAPSVPADSPAVAGRAAPREPLASPMDVPPPEPWEGTDMADAAPVSLRDVAMTAPSTRDAAATASSSTSAPPSTPAPASTPAPSSMSGLSSTSAPTSTPDAPSRPASPARAALDALRAAGGTARRRAGGPGLAAPGTGNMTDARPSPRGGPPAPARADAAAGRPSGPAARVQAPSAPPEPDAAPPAEPEPPVVIVSLASLSYEGDWPALAAALPLRGLAKELACRSELVEVDGTRLVLRVPVPQLAEPTQVEKLAGALAERLGQAVDITVVTGQARHTAAAVEAAQRARQQQQAERAIEEDAFVQSLIRDFDATIVPGSIRPLSPPNSH